MKFLDRIRDRKLKGAVLFTVVSVCAVIIIFVMATLTIVATVQRRTYSDYAKSQSYYTARSAVNSVITALNQDDAAAKDLAATFKNISGRTELSINMGDNADLGQITSCYVDKISDEMYKICATARVLDDESTVAVYVYEGTKIEPSSGSSNSSAITTFGLSNADNLGFLGGGAINIYDEKCPSQDSMTIGNQNDIVGGAIINAHTNMGTSAGNTILEKGQGMAVFGDYQNSSGGLLAGLYNLSTSDAAADKYYHNSNWYKFETLGTDEEAKISDIPYVFCTGKFTWFRTGGARIGMKDEAANLYAPVNIFCGYYYEENNSASIVGSIYCNDATKTSILKGDGFNLYNWVESLQGDGTAASATYNGDFYTKGNLSLENGHRDYNFYGDLCVDGTLTIAKDARLNVYGGTIKAGKIVNNGTIKIGDASGNNAVEVQAANVYQTSTDANMLSTLSVYFAAVGVADWDAFRAKLVSNPAAKTSISGPDGNYTYQDILDSLTFFNDDYEMKNILEGYYYALDINNNADDSVIYHDDYSDVGEPATYEYQQPESGFIRTTASIRQQFPTREKVDPNEDTIYECEKYTSKAEFDAVLQGDLYLEIENGQNGEPFKIRLMSGNGNDITDQTTNLENYYVLDKANSILTVTANARFKGELSEARNGAGYTIYIDPQTAGKDLYVEMVDVTTENIKWVVNDNVPEGTSNPKICNMYFCTDKPVTNKNPDGSGVYSTTSFTMRKGYIASGYYADYFSGTVPTLYLEQYPDSDSKQIPNIYIGVQPYTHVDLGPNECAITAYLTAPRSSVQIQKGYKVGEVYYTTGDFDESKLPNLESTGYYQKLGSQGLSLVGSFVFDGTKTTSNNVSFIYISDEGRGDDDNEDDGNEVFTWQPLYYDSN